jgi:hypothetical protein
MDFVHNHVCGRGEAPAIFEQLAQHDACRAEANAAFPAFVYLGLSPNAITAYATGFGFAQFC